MLVALLKFVGCVCARSLSLQFLCSNYCTVCVMAYCVFNAWMKVLERTRWRKKDEKCKWKNGFYFPLSLLASLWQRAQISKEDKARAMSVCVHSSERANKQHQQQQQNEQWQWMRMRMWKSSVYTCKMRIESKTINIKGHLFRFKCCHVAFFSSTSLHSDIFGIFEFKTNLTLDIRFYWTWTCSCTPSQRRSHYSVCQ